MIKLYIIFLASIFLFDFDGKYAHAEGSDDLKCRDYMNKSMINYDNREPAGLKFLIPITRSMAPYLNILSVYIVSKPQLYGTLFQQLDKECKMHPEESLFDAVDHSGRRVIDIVNDIVKNSGNNYIHIYYPNSIRH